MTNRKRIVVYCQHLSGAGHYVRSREIVRALARHHEVHFFVGGRSVPGPALGESVRLVQLPAIYRSAEGLTPVEPRRTIDEVFAERKAVLDRMVREIRPDVLIIEHFPFSKWSLQPELLAAIEASRAVNPRVQVVSSIRDHPAGHEIACSPDEFRSQVLSLLNTHFSALLVHADPRVIRLESQFSWVPDISIPIHYTGYVSEKPMGASDNADSGSINPARNCVLVSSGALVDGFRLATLCSGAWQRLFQQGATGGRQMLIFAGLFAEECQYERLERATEGGPFTLRRFSGDFLRWMPAADLSISQGGYNTTMNVLETRTRAILAPNRRTSDQPLRARSLAEQGLVGVIDPETITVDQLAERILHGLSLPRPRHDIDLEGAERTREVIDAV